MPVINPGVLDGVRRIGHKIRDLVIDGGLPGAPLGYRLRGASQSGPPASGTWRAGDLVPDRAGKIFICTVAGTPGTWVQVGLSGGTFTAALVMQPVVLTDAATIAVNAALGNQFKVTLGGNRTLGAPSNPSDGQIITVWFIQDGTGTRTIALALSPGTAGGYFFGTDLTSITLSTAAGVMDKATFQYDLTNNRWDVTGFLRGF